jgi:hypothetical protein
MDERDGGIIAFERTALYSPDMKKVYILMLMVCIDDSTPEFQVSLKDPKFVRLRFFKMNRQQFYRRSSLNVGWVGERCSHKTINSFSPIIGVL